MSEQVAGLSPRQPGVPAVDRRYAGRRGCLPSSPPGRGCRKRLNVSVSAKTIRWAISLPVDDRQAADFLVRFNWSSTPALCHVRHLEANSNRAGQHLEEDSICRPARVRAMIRSESNGRTSGASLRSMVGARTYCVVHFQRTPGNVASPVARRHPEGRKHQRRERPRRTRSFWSRGPATEFAPDSSNGRERPASGPRADGRPSERRLTGLGIPAAHITTSRRVKRRPRTARLVFQRP
jgi:hypothetical protein